MQTGIGVRGVMLALPGLLLSLAGCGSSEPPGADSAGEGGGVQVSACRTAPYPSELWTQCEAENFAKTSEAPAEQSADPEFVARWSEQSTANILESLQRDASDPFWDTNGNVCATWGNNCQGDPFRYPGTDDWYDTVGTVMPVNFYDRDGARLSGRVWVPKNAEAGALLPSVVIMNGSVQAPEPLYWWAAQLLVSNGYAVMSFDPRGQGRSDNRTPDGQTGSNANPVVFRRNLVDAIDFFLSTPDQPYPYNLPGAPGPDGDGNLAETTAFNPIYDRIDPQRLGIAGHSLGATGVSVVQGQSPWDGRLTVDNPVKAAVAWDNLALGSALDGFEVVPRVPAMGQSGDYFLTPTPYRAPPDPLDKNAGFERWLEAGVDVYQVNIQGGTHYEWSLLHQFPATSWEGGRIIAADGSELGSGWGNVVAQYYTLAWFDRYLKRPGEMGYADADQRLLNDALLRERFSWYFPSRRAYTSRDGRLQRCDDIAMGCD